MKYNHCIENLILITNFLVELQIQKGHKSRDIILFYYLFCHHHVACFYLNVSYESDCCKEK